MSKELKSKDMIKPFENLVSFHLESIEELSKDLKLGKGISSLPIIETKYTLFYDKLMKVRSSAQKELDTLFKDNYYNIKIGSHELSNIHPTTHQEIKALALHDDTYLAKRQDVEEIENMMKTVENMMKIISSFSFHLRFNLDLEKFKNGK